MAAAHLVGRGAAPRRPRTRGRSGPDVPARGRAFLGIMPKDAELLISVFKRIAQSGCAVAITGHEVHSLFEAADDVLWMTAGTTHVLGTPAKARQHDQFCREYLGPEALA